MEMEVRNVKMTCTQHFDNVRSYHFFQQANNAALNVYLWNKFGLSLSQTMDDVSLADMAQLDNHENNTLAEEYDNEYSIDDLVESVIMKTNDFNLASSIERREVVKALLGTVVLPIYAFDSMWNAVDNCNDGINQQDTSEWDKAVASLVGLLRTSKGTMIYGVGQLMCLTAGICIEGEEAEVNEELLKTLNDGKDDLLDGNCMSAEAVVQYQIVIYLQVSFVIGQLPSIPCIFSSLLFFWTYFLPTDCAN